MASTGLADDDMTIAMSLQAAMLDSGITVTLGQLLARLLPALTDATKAAEAAALTTMVLEIINVLCNLDICLDPAVSQEQRAMEDCIAPNEVGLLCNQGRLESLD